MTAIRRFFDRIPRRLRIAVDLALALALLLAGYIAAGCPAFGYESAFRRAEKAGMVGPSALMDCIWELSHEVTRLTKSTSARSAMKAMVLCSVTMRGHCATADPPSSVPSSRCCRF